MIRNGKRQVPLVSALLIGAAAIFIAAQGESVAAASSGQPAAAPAKRIHIMSAGVYAYRAGESLGRYEWEAVERAVRKECQGKASCTISATSEWLQAREPAYKDPAPGTPKRAEIRYRCADGAS